MSSDRGCAIRAQPTIVEEPGRDPATPTSRSWASAPAVRRSMQGNRRRDTKPEIAVRRLLHAAGLRYRVDVRPVGALNRRADIVFTRAKVAVFIDGCFWHGCPDHHTVSKANASYWAAKVERNRERDADTDRRLKAAGWHVMRSWEHEAPQITADRIVEVVHARRKGLVSRRP
jgi:DNA mismatch endonuclease (patch repair protein)